MTDTESAGPADKANPLDEILRRLDALEGQNDIPALQAILVDVPRMLGLAESAVLEDELRRRTGFSQRVVSALIKEASSFCEGHGYLNTTQDIVEAYLKFLYTHYESLVWVGDSLYVFEASSKEVTNDTALIDNTGFYQRINIDELRKDLVEAFGELPGFSSEGSRREVLAQLRLHLLKDDFFVDAQSGVNLRNLFLSMDEAGNLNLLPHSPAHKARMRIEADYDPAAAFDWLDAAITLTLPDQLSRDALQEIAGAILFNIRPSKDSVRGMFILYGPRNSGKSTIITLLEALLPSAVVGSVPPENWGDPNYRAALEGLLLNVVTELGGTTRIGGEHMKKIVSCEQMIVRRMRRDPVNIVPLARHLFATNELPRVIDKTDAFERRMLVLTFPRSLERHEVDGNFLGRLQANPSAILNWAAAGAARLMATGAFTVPLGHHLAAAEMQHGGDAAMVFAHTQVRQSPGSRVTTAELRDAMRAFAEQRDLDPNTMHDGAIRKVADVMQKKHGATRRKTNGNPFYEGVSLVSHTPDPRGPDEVDLDEL